MVSSIARVSTMIICVLIMALPLVAEGQESPIEFVHVGDGIIDGRRIAPYIHAWRSYRVDVEGNEHELAIWYDTVSVVHRDGKDILKRVQWIVSEERIHNTAPERS